jgi:hypothetical protein
MAPARVVGRFHGGLRAASAADATGLRSLPRAVVVVGLPLLIIVMAAVVSLLHATSVINHTTIQIDWFRIQVDDLFTESPPFLILAVAVGAFSPALGVFLVCVFGVMDLAAGGVAAEYLGIHKVPDPAFTLVAAVTGRLVSLGLLWLVVVEIPIVGRQLGLSWRRLGGSRLAVAALTGAATMTFVWVWTQAATVLIRPVFTWSFTLIQPRVEAVAPIQDAGLVFAIVGGLVAGLVALTRGPSGLLEYPTADAAPLPSGGGPGVVRRLIRRLVVAGLLTLLLGGLITVPLEAVLIFATLASARPLAQLVANRTILGTAVGVLPPIARFAVAAAVTFIVAQVTIGPLYDLARTDPGLVPEYFSVIVSMIIGIFVVQLATTPSSAGARPLPPPVPVTAVVAFLLVIATLLLLAAPALVFADNDAGLVDTWGYKFVAGLAAGALSLFMAAFDKTPPIISDLAPFATEDGAKFEGDLFTMMNKVNKTNELADKGIPED